MSEAATVDYLREKRASICRYGDGELGVVLMYYGICNSESRFQDYDEDMARRMAQILKDDGANGKCLVALPGTMFSHGTKAVIKNSRNFWQSLTVRDIDNYLKIINLKRWYGDAIFTRFYITRKDKRGAATRLERVRRLWENENVVIVEGEYTRMGVGNDLFSNAASIRRVLCPATNAYSRYDLIINKVREVAHPGDLILLALGMTATVMAYDLAQDDYWAIDLGHLDIEYEWMRMGATSKVPIPNKFTNEAEGGNIHAQSSDAQYHREIVAQIV